MTPKSVRFLCVNTNMQRTRTNHLSEISLKLSLNDDISGNWFLQSFIQFIHIQEHLVHTQSPQTGGNDSTLWLRRVGTKMIFCQSSRGSLRACRASCRLAYFLNYLIGNFFFLQSSDVGTFKLFSFFNISFPLYFLAFSSLLKP